jgi:hypothetical protein
MNIELDIIIEVEAYARKYLIDLIRTDFFLQIQIKLKNPEIPSLLIHTHPFLQGLLVRDEFKDQT